MDAGTLLLFALAGGLLVQAWRRPQPVAGQAVTLALADFLRLLPRLVLVLLTAGFVAALLPREFIASLIGAESGIVGILIASAVGGFVPAGPIIAFPVIVALFEAGAGIPQLVAFTTAWSVFAFHRVMIYELTLMGWRFSVARIVASLILPPVTGLLAAGLLRLI